MNRKHETRVTGFVPEVLELFQVFDWPGNIRELRNVLERAVILTAQGEIPVKNLPQHIQSLKPVVVAAAAAEASPMSPQTVPETLDESVLESGSGDGHVDPALMGLGVTDLEAIRVPIGTTVEVAEKRLNPAHFRAYAQQQNTGSRYSRHQLENPAQQAERIRGAGRRLARRLALGLMHPVINRV